MSSPGSMITDDIKTRLARSESGLWNGLGKRVFDFCIALAGLMALSPFFIIFAVAVKLEDGGPIFFRHMRMGRGFKPFGVMKFRSMITDAASRGPQVTVGGDSRITRVGRILRKTKIDELPQLINVVIGDMSLVGPRPEVKRYVDMFPVEYEQLLKFRPGITDLASITYRDEERVLASALDAEAMYVGEVLPNKLRLNLVYLGRMSLIEDARIILRTAMSL